MLRLVQTAEWDRLSEDDQDQLRALLPMLDMQSDGPSDEDRERWRKDPSAFAEEVFGKKLWSKQREIALACVEENARVATKSSHKIGKSMLAAIIAFWWIAIWDDAQVVATAPTARQVRDILWAEMLKLWRKRKRDFISCKCVVNKSPSNGVKCSDGRVIVGFSTKDADKMSGYSSPHLLYLVDEASGVPNSIFESIMGNQAGGASLFLISNPLRPSGFFYECFSTASKGWKLFTVSAYDTPNLTGEAKIPGLATKQWIEEVKERYHEGSAYFDCRVLGKFPSTGSKAVCRLIDVEAAMERNAPENGPLMAGLDVAEFGDDESVLTWRRGDHVYASKRYPPMDGCDLAGQVLADLRQIRRPGEKPTLFVDLIGVGAGPWAILSRSEEIDAYGVKASDRANSDIEYANRRTELYFGMSQRLRVISIPADADLKTQLIAPEYGFDVKARLQVEKKEKIKEKLGGKSPDLSDSLMLCLLEPEIDEDVDVVVSRKKQGRRSR